MPFSDKFNFVIVLLLIKLFNKIYAPASPKILLERFKYLRLI